jgi:hydroxymethylpyrimidine kinase/phosphomethylpyrimidine kinase
LIFSRNFPRRRTTISSIDSPPVALTIAGSDSGGGAGIQADLKAMTHAGVHGCTAMTALTAQNSLGVNGIDPVEPEFVAEQIEAVVEDFDVRATKTGMLFSAPIIRTVFTYADRLGQIVVDPVMVAESGDPLLEPEAEQAIAESLMPVADLVTPNWPEAQRLAATLHLDVDESPGAMARALAAETGTHLLVKGGHTEDDESVDRLARPDGSTETFRAERLDTDNTHGSGCAYSSLIASKLAHGEDLTGAIENAKETLTEALRTGYGAGEGAGTLNFLR